MHHELPERLDIAWYRARARELHRSVQAGNAESQQRVEEAIGRRPIFKLADAQHVIALEHGFAHWADFKRWVETRSPEPKVVGRIGRAPVSTYERRAQQLIEQERSLRIRDPRQQSFNLWSQSRTPIFFERITEDVKLLQQRLRL